MHFTTTLAWGASLLSVAEAIQLQRRTDGAPARVLHLETTRKRSTLNPLQRDRLRKRQSKSLNVNLDNEQTLYFANVSIGTPAQSLRLDIDTGSSDLWTNAAGSQLCTQRGGSYCAASGTYTANDSSTYQYVNSAFLIKYADGSEAAGDYATDIVALGGTAIQSVQFGIGYTSSSGQGILGVGYMTNEAAVQYGSSYKNLPQRLKDDGVTSANAYSLWLNDLDASTGSILFGGVDTAKYNGNLQSVPVIKEQGTYSEFIVALSGLQANGQTLLTSSNAIPVLLDSGSSLSYLPDDLANSLFSAVGATSYDTNAGAAIVPCSLANQDSSVTFEFSGIQISVPYNELVIINGYTRRNTPICILGVTRAGSTTSVLGDTFLRSAYVVYDLDANEISLANTNFNATGSSNVQEITTGSNGVPGATAVANPVTSLSVEATGGARVGSGSASSAAAAVPLATPAPLGGVLAAAAVVVGALAI